MRKAAVRAILGAACLALGIGVVSVSQGTAGMADIKDNVQAIADALAKGDTASVEDAMHLFGLRKAAKSKGYGVGDAAGKITPDGIEAKILNFSKKAPAKAAVTKDGEALVTMAYRTAAIAEFAIKKAPEKDMPGKKVSDWKMWAGEMKTSALDLASALKEQDPAKIKTAASKLSSSCSNCHGVFRD
jgi:hypothetical protein